MLPNHITATKAADRTNTVMVKQQCQRPKKRWFVLNFEDRSGGRRDSPKNTDKQKLGEQSTPVSLPHLHYCTIGLRALARLV